MLRKGVLDELHQDQKLHFGMETRWWAPGAERERVAYVRDMILAAQVELVETLQEFPWKPWGDYTSADQEEAEYVAGEMVDVLHFVGHVLNVAGVSEEMLEAQYQRKRQINAERQRRKRERKAG